MFVIEYKNLSDIFEVKIGSFIHKNFQNENYPFPVYNGGETNTGFYNEFNFEANKIIISARGNAGFVNKVESKFWAGNSCYVLDKIKVDFINWKYFYHLLKQKQSLLMDTKQKGGIPAISKKQVEELIIPIPHISIQNKIVDILDKLETYVNDIKQGLPLEIEQRKKQYSHYRDKLLSFNNLENNQ